MFIEGKPANNVLMTGTRGTGKSSLVRAMLVQFARRGLRLIEVDKSDLGDLQELSIACASAKESYIIFCDDLSFEQGEEDIRPSSHSSMALLPQAVTIS